MPVTGSGAKRLPALSKMIGSIGSASFRSAFGRAIAAAAVKQVRDEFRESRDPYGKRWPALTSRTGKPLEDTGALLVSLAGGKRPTATTRGFMMGTNRKGATVHQYGATIVPVRAKALRFFVRGKPTGRSKRGGKIWITTQRSVIPRRQFMPENNTGGLGKIWGAAFDREAEEFMRDYVKGV